MLSWHSDEDDNILGDIIGCPHKLGDMIGSTLLSAERTSEGIMALSGAHLIKSSRLHERGAF